MNFDAKSVLKSALGQFFMYNKYPVAIIELRKAISNQAYYKDNWHNVIKLILNKNFIEGEPLEIMDNDANLSIYENNDAEALKWFQLLLINSMMPENYPVINYEDFFNNGMTPKGTHDNLLMHTESNTTAGNFISTTLDKDIATQFGSQNGWVFEIRSSNGIDINKTLGADALHPGQLEVSIPDVILSKDIKGVWQKQGGVLTTWIPNPNYIQ